MENKKVMVENLSHGRVGINVPDLRLRRIWERKGAKKPIDLHDLMEAIYDPGVEAMFKEGILGIDDMEVKIALGLEPEGATEPVNTITLTDQQRRRYLTLAPLHELKELLPKLPKEQVLSLVDYAIEHELTIMDRAELLKKATGIDIVRAVQLKKQDEED